MKISVYNRLKKLSERYNEINLLLLNPDITKDTFNYKLLLKERSDLENVVEIFDKYILIEKNIKNIQSLLFDVDHEIRLLSESENKILNKEKQDLINVIYNLLIEKNLNDKRNIFLEIRA